MKNRYKLILICCLTSMSYAAQEQEKRQLEPKIDQEYCQQFYRRLNRLSANFRAPCKSSPYNFITSDKEIDLRPSNRSMEKREKCIMQLISLSNIAKQCATRYPSTKMLYNTDIYKYVYSINGSLAELQQEQATDIENKKYYEKYDKEFKDLGL